MKKVNIKGSRLITDNLIEEAERQYLEAKMAKDNADYASELFDNAGKDVLFRRLYR